MPKTILLVEDDPLDRELAMVAWERAGLAGQALALEDGAEALDYLFRRGTFRSRDPGHPAVIILDLKMPKIRGIEVLRAVRADRATAQTPVVMLTGSREERDLLNSYQLGVNAYVVKPMELEGLVRIVQQITNIWVQLNTLPSVLESRP